MHMSHMHTLTFPVCHLYHTCTASVFLTNILILYSQRMQTGRVTFIWCTTNWKFNFCVFRGIHEQQTRFSEETFCYFIGTHLCLLNNTIPHSQCISSRWVFCSSTQGHGYTTYSSTRYVSCTLLLYSRLLHLPGGTLLVLASRKKYSVHIIIIVAYTHTLWWWQQSAPSTTTSMPFLDAAMGWIII